MKKHFNSGKYKNRFYIKRVNVNLKLSLSRIKSCFFICYFRLVLVYKVFSRHVSTVVKPKKKNVFFEIEFDAMIA